MTINTYKLSDDKILLSSEVAHGNKTLEQILNKLVEKVLYSNDNGTNGNITLSETSANFEYLEIFYRSSDSTFNSVKVYKPNGKRVYLNSGWPSSTLYYKAKVIEISGTSITNTNGLNTTAIANNKSPSTTTDNLIFITRVVGYK